MRAGLGEERGFQVRSSSIPPCPMSKVVLSLATGSLTFKFWKATKGSCNSGYCFGNILDSPDRQLEERFPMPGTGVPVSLYFGGDRPYPKYIYVCVIYNYDIHVVVVFINVK